MIFEIADLEIKNLGRFRLKIAMCSNFYQIWYLVQIMKIVNEHANYVMKFLELMILTQNYRFGQIWSQH